MKSKKKMLLALGAMSVAAIGAGSVSTFAWYVASATVNVSSVTEASNTLSTTSVSEIESAYNISASITFSVSGSPVQVDNDGHEWGNVDAGGNSRVDFDDETFRVTTVTPAYTAPDRYFTVASNPTVTLTGDNDALDAAKGKSWSGVVKVYTTANSSTVSSRHALHDNTDEITGDGDGDDDVHYLSTIVTGIAITITADSSTRGAATAAMESFYVCVGGGTITWNDAEGHEGEYSSMSPVNDTDTVQGFLRVLTLS